jgi:hypothetical protein
MIKGIIDMEVYKAGVALKFRTAVDTFCSYWLIANICHSSHIHHDVFMFRQTAAPVSCTHFGNDKNNQRSTIHSKF